MPTPDPDALALNEAATECPVPKTVRGPLRWVLLGFGWLCVGLGLIGVVLPVLPTTPLLLLALWAFSLSSHRLSSWLFDHPQLGPYVQDWHREQAIPLRAKVLAISMMAGAWSLIVLGTGSPWAAGGSGVTLFLVAIYIARRPLPRPCPRLITPAFKALLSAGLMAAMTAVLWVGIGRDSLPPSLACLVALSGALLYVLSRPTKRLEDAA